MYIKYSKFCHIKIKASCSKSLSVFYLRKKASIHLDWTYDKGHITNNIKEISHAFPIINFERKKRKYSLDIIYKEHENI